MKKEDGYISSIRSKDQLMIDSRENENGASFSKIEKERKHLNLTKNLNLRINLNIIQNIYI